MWLLDEWREHDSFVCLFLADSCTAFWEEFTPLFFQRDPYTVRCHLRNLHWCAPLTPRTLLKLGSFLVRCCPDFDFGINLLMATSSLRVCKSSGCFGLRSPATMASCTTTGVHILRGASIEPGHAVLLSSTSVPFLINRTPQTDTAALLSPLQRILSSPFSPWCKLARHHIMTCRVGQQICRVLVPPLIQYWLRRRLMPVLGTHREDLEVCVHRDG